MHNFKRFRIDCNLSSGQNHFYLILIFPWCSFSHFTISPDTSFKSLISISDTSFCHLQSFLFHQKLPAPRFWGILLVLWEENLCFPLFFDFYMTILSAGDGRRWEDSSETWKEGKESFKTEICENKNPLIGLPSKLLHAGGCSTEACSERHRRYTAITVLDSRVADCLIIRHKTRYCIGLVSSVWCTGTCCPRSAENLWWKQLFQFYCNETHMFISSWI